MMETPPTVMLWVLLEALMHLTLFNNTLSGAIQIETLELYLNFTMEKLLSSKPHTFLRSIHLKHSYYHLMVLLKATRKATVLTLQ